MARRRGALWSASAALEVLLAAVAVARDLFVPTFVLLGLAALSLGLRREGLSSLGLTRPDHPWTMTGQVFALTVGWTLVQLGVVMPVLNHLTGDRQDLSDFAGLEGDLGRLLLLVVLSWTLAAFGEELAYRGFVLTRLRDVLGTGRLALAVAVLGSALLFGLAHTEQGAIGVVVTSLDAVFLSALRLHYRTLFAPVLAHGFNNTIGLTAFYLVGPVYGLW